VLIKIIVSFVVIFRIYPIFPIPFLFTGCSGTKIINLIES
jgi:hypothetical protein